MTHALMLTTEELRLLYVATGLRAFISDAVKEQMERHLDIAKQTREHADNTNEQETIQLWKPIYVSSTVTILPLKPRA